MNDLSVAPPRTPSRACRGVRHLLASLALALSVGAWAPARSDVGAGPRTDPEDAALDPSLAQPLPSFPPTLEGQIDAALAQPFLATAQVGVVVVDLGSGETIYQRGADLPLNPASNQKLVTTVAALGLLGPAHRYATRLYHERDALKDSTIEGDVWLRGSGDPDLVTEDLYALVSDLRARGIRRITGGIVVDSSRFDRDELPPGFDQKDELASYRAPSGATSVNYNTFVVRVRPATREGEAPWAAIEPPVPSITLVNEALTQPGHLDRLAVAIDVDKKVMKVTLRGNLGLEAGSQSYRYPVVDPSRYAGEVLAHVFKQRGIKIGRTKIKTGGVPGDAQLVGVHNSAPLSVLIRAINKHSNNFMAEQILKTLAPAGGPATFGDALARVRSHLGSIGVPSEGLRIGNGSGLYDTNRVTAAQMTALLGAAHTDFRIGSDFMASLAIMGVDGTTRSRLRENSRRGLVRAKTGTLDGVYCLSGYAGAQNRAPLAFAILFNGVAKADAGMARAAQNRIAEILALFAAGEPLVVAPVVVTDPAAAPAVDSD